MRFLAMLVVLLGTACAYEPLDSDPASGDDVQVTPMTIDDHGEPRAFYLTPELAGPQVATAHG